MTLDLETEKRLLQSTAGRALLATAARDRAAERRQSEQVISRAVGLRRPLAQTSSAPDVEPLTPELLAKIKASGRTPEEFIAARNSATRSFARREK